jgi:hypothetical protein
VTIDELQDCLDAADAAVLYLGPWSATMLRDRRVALKYVCSIGVAKTSTRWQHGDWTMRGKGSTMEAALNDALCQLAAFMLKHSRELEDSR